PARTGHGGGRVTRTGLAWPPVGPTRHRLVRRLQRTLVVPVPPSAQSPAGRCPDRPRRSPAPSDLVRSLSYRPHRPRPRRSRLDLLQVEVPDDTLARVASDHRPVLVDIAPPVPAAVSADGWPGCPER